MVNRVERRIMRRRRVKKKSVQEKVPINYERQRRKSAHFFRCYASAVCLAPG